MGAAPSETRAALVASAARTGASAHAGRVAPRSRAACRSRASRSALSVEPALRVTLRASLAVCLVLLLGCEPPVTCEVEADVEAATAEDRRLLGLPDPYPADAMLAARDAELRTSMRARRAAAWEVVARVFSPVELAHPTGVDGASVPRFRTWYDRDDLARVFRRAYEALGRDGRVARMHLPEALLDEAFFWNPSAILEVPGWSETRFTEYAESLSDELAIARVGGLVRIGMSPDVARHVADSYPEILRCLNDGAPPAFVDGPAEASQRLAREPVALASCEVRTFGPYFVATGGRIEAHLESGSGSGDLRLIAGESRALGEEVCVVGGAAPCEADGPGPFYVEVASIGQPVSGMLEVTYVAPDITDAGCLNGVFPLASATVAAEWRRADLGPLPTFDTTASSLAAHLAAPDATWGEGDGTASPDASAIYTLQLASGGTFVLAGLHIRTRELSQWMNITLWWSPTPDTTFGADRSASVEALGAPWNQYAMCVTVDDVEGDPDPRGGVDDEGLGDALAAVHEGEGGPTWCSNPYIDGAPGLVRSNCVGCHQHGFTGVRPGETVMDEARFPAHGRLWVRNNAPADQFWGLDAGDDLAAMVQETIDYWAGADL